MADIDIDSFYNSQLASWETARENYEGLKSVVTRSIGFDRFRIEIQFNPRRARSTTADTGNIKSRPCFLCENNRPPEQTAIDYGGYHILVNPYPIFEKHLTIACKKHTGQSVKGRMQDMLEFASLLPEFVILYNGPASGASAPDHMHFQAVPKGNLPLEKDVELSEVIAGGKGIEVSQIRDYLRKIIIIKGDTLLSVTTAINNILARLTYNGEEPRVNIFAWKTEGVYTVAIFPRTAHRPRQYYAEGGDRILFSPGAVDMAGVEITVRKEDFDRLSPSLLEDLFAQVTPDDSLFKDLTYSL